MSAWTREAFGLFPGGVGMPRMLVSLLAELNARELLARAAAPASIEPEALATTLLAEYDARCEVSGASPRFRADVIECLSHLGCVAATAARRAGDLERARRHVAWMVALGGMLVDRPGLLGGGHVMISRAREQEAKIGWVVGDLATVDRALRAALAEATLAFNEAPEEPAPREQSASMREKYARLAAAEPERPRPAEASR
jgi:hypothetical protein